MTSLCIAVNMCPLHLLLQPLQLPCSIAPFFFILVTKITARILPILLAHLSPICDLYIGVGLQLRLPAVSCAGQGMRQSIPP